MHKPLSLNPRRKAKEHEAGSSNSSINQCSDSLALSLSEDKRCSNKSSQFGDNYRHSVSKQLESLQIKLEDLETQIMPITLETCKTNSRNQTIKYANKFDHNSTAEFFKRRQIRSEGKENCMQKANVGKIVRRQDRIKGKKDICQDNSKNSHSLMTESSDLLQKSKEVSRLKKEVEGLRSSLEKSQRSASMCSERLSASKSIIKTMKL